MGKTIEERLECLLYERDLRHGWIELDASKAEYLDRTTNGMCVDIADDWNTMLAALCRLRDNLFSNSELDAIIAKMEGTDA